MIKPELYLDTGYNVASVTREDKAVDACLSLDVARVVGAASLNEELLELFLVDIVEGGAVHFDGEVLDDGLDVSLVDGDARAAERRDLLADPSDEEELGSLGLLVAGDELDVGVEALVLGELALELLDATVALALKCEHLLGVVGVAEEAPVDFLGSLDLVVSLNQSGIRNVDHFRARKERKKE